MSVRLATIITVTRSKSRAKPGGHSGQRQIHIQAILAGRTPELLQGLPDAFGSGTPVKLAQDGLLVWRQPDRKRRWVIGDLACHLRGSVIDGRDDLLDGDHVPTNIVDAGLVNFGTRRRE